MHIHVHVYQEFFSLYVKTIFKRIYRTNIDTKWKNKHENNFDNL